MGFYNGRKLTSNKLHLRRNQKKKWNSSIALGEPNKGRYVTLKNVAKDEALKETAMKQLIAWAKKIQEICPDSELSVHDDRVTLKFNSDKVAEEIRALWKH